MNKRSAPSLKMNLAVNISYQVILVLISLIIAPYVSRTIGPVGTGIYAYTFSVASCFALFGMLGIGNYGNRSVAAVGADNIRSRSLLYFLYCLFFPIDNKLIAFIQGITVLCVAFDISWFFYGIEKFPVTVLRNLIVKLLNLALIFIFVKSENDLVIYVIIMLAGILLNNLMLFLFLKNEVVFVRPTWDNIRRHIKPIIVLFFPIIAISIYKLMDKIMIGWFGGTAETGYYEYAEKIINLPATIIAAIGAVMLPRLSAVLGKNEQRRASFLVQITMEAMMFLTIGMSAGIFCVGRDFAPIYFGDEFARSGLIMMALAPSVVFQGWANVIRTEYLIPEKKDTVYVKSTWLGAAVNLIMNIILIPRWGASGAAIGTVCAEASVAVYQSLCARKGLPLLDYLKVVWEYLVPAAIMWVAVSAVRVWLTDNTILKIVAEIAVGAFVYLTVSFPFVFKRIKELRRIKRESAI